MLSAWEGLGSPPPTPAPALDSLATITPRNESGRALFLQPVHANPTNQTLSPPLQQPSTTLGIFPLSTGRLHIFLLPVPNFLFLLVTAVAALMAALAAGLLLHLCIFHIYIHVHGLTTYEYVRTQRAELLQQQAEQQAEQQVEQQVRQLSSSDHCLGDCPPTLS